MAALTGMCQDALETRRVPAGKRMEQQTAGKSAPQRGSRNSAEYYQRRALRELGTPGACEEP